MSELQVTSGVFAPSYFELGTPQETAVAPVEHMTQITGKPAEAHGPDVEAAYRGPELVLPQPEDIPAKTQGLVKETHIMAEDDMPAIATWQERVVQYARRTAIVATLGGVLASAACSSETSSPGSAQSRGTPSATHSASTPAPAPTLPTTALPAPAKPSLQPSIGSVLYPCTFTGHSDMPSTDARVRSGTSIDERAVAKLLNASFDDIAKCDAPRLVEGDARSPAVLTGAEYLQKSTGDRVVITVTSDTINTTTGRPNLIDVYINGPNPAASMGYDEYEGAFTCSPAPDDLTRVAECDGIMTVKKDPRHADQFYVMSMSLFENSGKKSGLGRMGKDIVQTAGDRLEDFNSLLGANMPPTIAPPEVG